MTLSASTRSSFTCTVVEESACLSGYFFNISDLDIVLSECGWEYKTPGVPDCYPPLRMRFLASEKVGRTFSRFLIVLLLCTECCGLALGQSSLSDSFTAIPPEQVSRYHIDFSRHFFASREIEKTERATLYAIVSQLESLKRKVATSAANLQRALELNDRVQIQFQRHYSYLYLRNAVNTLDETSLSESSALDSNVSARTAFLRQELMQISDRTLAQFVRRNPSLKAYLFAIEEARRYRPYTLSLKEEELLSATAPNSDWAAELYDMLRAQPQGIPLRRDEIAFTLIRLAATRTRLAQLHHFADAPSEAYFNSYWTRSEVDTLMEQVAQHADLYKRYQRMRSEYRSRSGSETPMQLPQFTIQQASEKIRQALEPLGQDYGRELEALLDPANGRMDIVAGQHRKRGGFSQGFIGTDSVFYSAGFAGSYNDVRVLTHESTHAVHRQLMNLNQVLPAFAEGPHYLFEAFAIFNEFLLPQYLYSHETDPLRRQFYLERFLEGKGLEIFRVAPEVVFEDALYEGVRNGSIKTADDLDVLSQKIFSRYWTAGKNEDFKNQWMKISLMYEDPFYDVNYVYGSLLALNFYAMYLRDREHFVPRYIALMKNGFDAPPAVLLKRFLDLDLQDPRLLSNALDIMKNEVDLMEKSYQR